MPDGKWGGRVSVSDVSVIGCVQRRRLPALRPSPSSLGNGPGSLDLMMPCPTHGGPAV